ncbi:hyaluronidase-5-like [Dunckerocampus dactyliophorus]|uniref:hyaluronidase-5-like n=1 Tax=Dunckerocampus dactyliophorus TaxID=161453 RepID=UPI0024049174|nr:hyaluronidase-5-like [Dunckerocampus dactyliophorus]
MRRQHVACVIAMLVLLGSDAGSSPWTDPPTHADQPFLFMWNAPTELCDIHYGLKLDLSHFHMVSSTLKTATNQSISIFYTDRFGIFPYVDKDTGEFVKEGLPQLVDLEKHHEVARNDVEFYIPTDQPGLAVLDFEEWRPQWVRNWGNKDIYRKISIERVKKRNATLSDDEAEKCAKMLFEHAAKKYFLRSICIGKRLRPQRLWGYYLYPDCYNYNYNQDMDAFTGECPARERQRNDELLWLWRESTALFPSIYLELVLRDSTQARLFVRHRLLEAIRVSKLANSSYAIPVYAYIRPVYKDSTDDYMSEVDLVSTIGEAAALGTAGVVAWGDMKVTNSEKSCLDAWRHLYHVMNPYILNVTTATRMCSEALCQGQGRCVRKRWDDNVFLHLDPQRFQIQRHRPGGPLTVRGGGLLQDDVIWFDRHFDCVCYGQRPCRSAKMLNDIQEVASNARSREESNVRPSSRWPYVLLLTTVLVTSCPNGCSTKGM